jgi:hypothetical protein
MVCAYTVAMIRLRQKPPRAEVSTSATGMAII